MAFKTGGMPLFYSGLLALLLSAPISGDEPNGYFADQGARLQPVPDGVWRTVDPGGEGLTFAYQQHPVTGTFLVASDMSFSLLRSQDGGRSFQPIAPDGHPTLGALAAHPEQAGKWYAGFRFFTPGPDTLSGLYLTTDDGDSWRQVSQGHTFSRVSSFGHVVADNPDIVLWVTVKEGPVLSRDGGKSFAPFNEGLGSDGVPAFASDNGGVDLVKTVNVGDDTVLYLVWRDGVYRRSLDAQEWEKVEGLPQPSSPTEIAYDASAGLLWVSFAGKGVFRGDLSTGTWQCMNRAIGRPLIVRTHKDRPGWVWCLSGGPRVVYRSQDRGETWEPLSRDILCDNEDYQCNVVRPYRYGGSLSHSFFFVDPNDPNRLYLSDSMVSEDGGKSWQTLACRYFPDDNSWRGSGLTLLTDYCAWFDPLKPNRVFLGFSDTGLMRSDNRGFSIQRFVELFARPVSDIAYWAPQLVLSSGSCMAFAIDPERPTTYYYALSGKAGTSVDANGVIFKTTNDGRNWDPIFPEISGLPNGTINDLLLLHGNGYRERKMYALVNHVSGIELPELGMSPLEAPKARQAELLKLIKQQEPRPAGGLYVSDDSGDTWSCLAPAAEFRSCLPLMDLDYCRDHPEVMFLCSTTMQGKRPGGSFANFMPPKAERYGGVFGSDDGGQHWRALTDRSIPNVVQVVAHPHNPKIVFAAAVSGLVLGEDGNPVSVKGGIMRSQDGGNTWERVLEEGDWAQHLRGYAPRGATSVAINPELPSLVYAALNGDGVHRSPDGGDTWERVDWEQFKRYQGTYHTLAINPHDPAEFYLGLFGNSFVAYRDPVAAALLAERWQQPGVNLIRNGDFNLKDSQGMPRHWSVQNVRFDTGRDLIRLEAAEENGHFVRIHYAGKPVVDKRKYTIGAKQEGWLKNRLSPYAVQLCRGKRVRVSCAIRVNNVESVQGKPVLMLVQTIRGIPETVAEVPAVLVFGAPGGPKDGRVQGSQSNAWLTMESYANVSEDAEILEIVFWTARGENPVVADVDDFSLTLATGGT